jgi:putative RNA 2'-phosphotransferase
MAALYNPKTLAKTITYILVHAPGEYGLFWDVDGSMPWKELYWAMQEDPSLRFVRETHLREIGYLGIDLPAVVEGNAVKLKPMQPIPDYPIADPPPPRLFHACRGKSILYVREHGLAAAGRNFLPVTSNRELALRMARRRDPDPVLLEVLTAVALSEGIIFRSAGADLFLVERLPVHVLRFPLMSEEKLQASAAQRRKEKTPVKQSGSKAPGSFMVEMGHIHSAFGDPGGAGAGAPKGKGRKGAEWKRAARRERNKRNV